MFGKCSLLVFESISTGFGEYIIGNTRLFLQKVSLLCIEIQIVKESNTKTVYGELSKCIWKVRTSCYSVWNARTILCIHGIPCIFLWMMI